MPLLAEAVDVGLLKVSGATRRFLEDYRDAVNSGDYTPIEERTGAIEALQELKDLFADGVTCQQLKDFLYAMGLFGCARARRVKAMGAQLGFSDDDLEECFRDPDDDELKSYYLPPTTDSELPTFPAGCFDRGLTDDERGIFCPPTLEFHKDVPPDLASCASPGVMKISNPQDALCPTDVGYGCQEGDDADTEDLPEGPDCGGAQRLIDAMTDVALNPGAGRQLFTPATYLDMIYKTLAIKDRAREQHCTTVGASANKLIQGILDTVPINYIPRHLLPPEWSKKWLPKPSIPPDTPERQINFIPDRIYKRTIIGPDGTIIEYSGTSDPDVTPSPTPPEPAPPLFPDYDGLTPQEYANNYRENLTDAVDAGLEIATTLLGDIEDSGISSHEAAPWISIIDDALDNARELGNNETVQRLTDIRRQVVDAAGTFTGNPLRDTPPNLVPPGTQDE